MFTTTFLMIFMIGVTIGAFTLINQFIYDMGRNKDIWTMRTRFSHAWSNFTDILPITLVSMLLWAMASFWLATAYLKVTVGEKLIEELSVNGDALLDPAWVCGVDELNHAGTHEAYLSEAEQLGGVSELRQMIVYGVDELNNSGLCGGGGASDHYTWGVRARLGLGKMEPGTLPDGTKFAFRFSYKTCYALITSGLYTINRQCPAKCRFSHWRTAGNEGETWGITDKVRNVSYV